MSALEPCRGNAPTGPIVRPQSVTMTTMPIHITPVSAQRSTPVAGDRARDVLVHADDGALVHLADQWVDAPRALVLVFLRQLGCPLCQQQVAEFRDHAAAFESAGVGIAAVGLGSPEQARRLRDRLQVPFPILSDTRRWAYDAYGLVEGTAEQVYDPVSGYRLTRAILHGHLPRRTVGSTRQLPGVFVIDRDGIIRIAHPGRTSSDVPPVAALLGRILARVPTVTDLTR